jgi:hypothetical protein
MEVNRLKRINKANEFPKLKGVKVELETENGNSFSLVKLIDEEGNFVVFKKNSYDQLHVFGQDHPPLVKRYRVTGTVKVGNSEVDVDKIFEQDYEAREYQNSMYGEGHNLNISEVEVPEE